MRFQLLRVMTFCRRPLLIVHSDPCFRERFPPLLQGWWEAMANESEEISSVVSRSFAVVGTAEKLRNKLRRDENCYSTGVRTQEEENHKAWHLASPRVGCLLLAFHVFYVGTAYSFQGKGMVAVVGSGCDSSNHCTLQEGICNKNIVSPWDSLSLSLSLSPTL